jgi:hypothetical protein
MDPRYDDISDLIIAKNPPSWLNEVWALRDYSDSIGSDRDLKAVEEAATVSTFVISAEDITNHSESCSSTWPAHHPAIVNPWKKGSVVKSAKNGCRCCLLRLRAFRAIEKDIHQGEAVKYALAGFRCYGNGQFASDQGPHDDDGVMGFRVPRAYFDIFATRSRFSKRSIPRLIIFLQILC